MKKYTEKESYRTTKEQHETLKKMRKLNIDVSRFTREAIREKINRDHKEFIKPIEISPTCDSIIRQIESIS